MKYLVVALFGILVLGFSITYVVLGLKNLDEKPGGERQAADRRTGDKETSQQDANFPMKVVQTAPRVFPRGQKLFFWWDPIPDNVTQVSFETGPESNIHPADYVGADSCKKCHEENFKDWSEHPHRWMNAAADLNTVKGSFTEADEIQYLGGRGTFQVKDDKHQMTLERDAVKLVYEINQTLGSRFFQYYIGKLIDGPFDAAHPYRTTNHVLPFGYWLQKKSWVPVVHVGPELPDGERTDPFDMPQIPEEGKSFLPYAKYCNMCHSTFPLGDNLFRKPFVLERHFPGLMHLDMAGYIENVHGELWPDSMTRKSATTEQIFKIPAEMTKFDAATHGVSFGISCEACHFGCKKHAADPKQLPSFAPRSEYLKVQTETNKLETGRTHENLNWACGRCHTGNRPLYAGGMSTWNSTEYTDAMKGSCYSELTCIECHKPHEATGLEWPKTPAEDDATCIKCHQQYSSEAAIAKHTHHPIGSAGSRCMNCHMPKINEGLQNVVRTHTIFSPTSKPMLESNHPNACNLCHTDKPVEWTTRYLKEWYNAEFDQDKIAQNYSPNQNVGVGWLKSKNEAVRLVAINAMGTNQDKWAGEDLLAALDDPFLLNRQFAVEVIEKVFDVDLDEVGYKFYMTPEERKEPIAKLRAQLNPQK